MNNLNNLLVRQNRVSKKRNVIGLQNSGRSISLNQLNTDYCVNQLYKEQYFELKEQHEQTKRQLNKQQEQLKQLNYRLQRLLQEKKDFLSQFVHYSQVNVGCLVEDLEMANLRLEKENRKWKDQLLLAQVRAASKYKNHQLGKVMIINMKQQLQTNYDWVKARIDSGLNDRTKRNPSSGQLIRQQRRMVTTMLNSRKSLIDKTVNRTINRSINDKPTKLTNRPTINKERHRVSFSNQLEQEHLYEDDFEQDEEEIMEDEDYILDSSNEDEESKSSELERKNSLNEFQLANSDRLNTELDYKLNDKFANTIDTNEQIDKIDFVTDNQENFKQLKNQLNKAKNKIKKLNEIIDLQQHYIDKQQELTNQTHQLDSLKENWLKQTTNEKNLILDRSNERTIETNLTSTNLSSNSSSSLASIESIETAGGNLNELQISSNNIKQDQLVTTNYKKNKKSANEDYQIDRNGIDKSTEGELQLSSSTNDRKTPESTKSSIFGDEETNSTSSSLSSLDQLTLSVHVKHEKEKRILISNDEQVNLDKSLSDQNSKTEDLLANLSKQLQVEKVRNEQSETRNRGRLRVLEQNVNELSRENEILRNSLEKCLQDCLTDIAGSVL